MECKIKLLTAAVRLFVCQKCQFLSVNKKNVPFLCFLLKKADSIQDLLFLSSLKNVGPIVQWIECKIPVLMIWVRIPVGSLSINIKRCNRNDYSVFVFQWCQIWC